MGDLLKEAIADAKAVRETALANAKMALEEAFTPQLKSMLSAKLKEDEYEDEEDVVAEPEDEEEEIPAEEGSYSEDEEFGDEEDFGEEGDEEGDEEVGGEEPDIEEEGVIEINGVKYAPVVAEEDEEEFGGEEDEEEEGDLDLESIIKELEDELSEADDTEDDTVEEADDSDDETVEEADDSDDETVEETFDIDESLFTEEEDEEDEKEDEKEDEVEESTVPSDYSKISAELAEYKEAVSFLKDKLHEVNILNAKLLFTNKLFKEYSLDNNQKLKVVETFDRTQSTREIKLVYSTLSEQFSDNGSITKRHSIKESASSKSGSTKPSKESQKVITEESQVANRFKKLAGIL